jgi:hypothetical protein
VTLPYSHLMRAYTNFKLALHGHPTEYDNTHEFMKFLHNATWITANNDPSKVRVSQRTAAKIKQLLSPYSNVIIKAWISKHGQPVGE